MSDSAHIEALLPLISLPRCPTPLIAQTIRRSVIRFGEDTGLGAHTPYGREFLLNSDTTVSKTMDAGNSAITIDEIGNMLSDGDPIIMTFEHDYGEAAEFQSVTKNSATPSVLPSSNYSINDDSLSFTLIFDSNFTSSNLLSLVLFNAEDPTNTSEPVSDALFQIKISFVPSSATDWLEFIVSRWAHVLVAATESSLKRMIGSEQDPVPWMDLTGAALAEERYRDGVAEVKTRLLANHHEGDDIAVTGLEGMIW